MAAIPALQIAPEPTASIEAGLRPSVRTGVSARHSTVSPIRNRAPHASAPATGQGNVTRLGVQPARQRGGAVEPPAPSPPRSIYTAPTAVFARLVKQVTQEARRQRLGVPEFRSPTADARFNRTAVRRSTSASSDPAQGSAGTSAGGGRQTEGDAGTVADGPVVRSETTDVAKSTPTHRNDPAEWTVAVNVARRPFEAVAADVIEGVVVANQLSPQAASGVRDLLWARVAQAR